MLNTLPKSITLFAIYAVYFTTFLLAGGQKIKDGNVPDWFKGQFQKTFLAKLPGLTPAYWSIAALETAVPILLLISLVNQEWMTGNEMVFLQIGVAVSTVIFGVLGFGQRLAQDFPGAANSFFYFAGSLVTQMFLMKM